MIDMTVGESGAGMIALGDFFLLAEELINFSAFARLTLAVLTLVLFSLASRLAGILLLLSRAGETVLCGWWRVCG